MALGWLLEHTGRPARLWLAGGAACAGLAGAAVYLLDAPATDAATGAFLPAAESGTADPAALPARPAPLMRASESAGDADDPWADEDPGWRRPAEARDRKPAAPQEDTPESTALLGLGDPAHLPLPIDAALDGEADGLNGFGVLGGTSASLGGGVAAGSGAPKTPSGAMRLQAAGSAEGGDMRFGFRLNLGAGSGSGGSGADLPGGAAGAQSGFADSASGLSGGAGLGGLSDQLGSTTGTAGGLIGE